MLHNNNKVTEDVYSQETIRLIREHLIHSHRDKDSESLWVRFNRLLGRVRDQEMSLEATWNSYLKALEANKHKS